MQWSSHNKILIAWDGMNGPNWRYSGAPVYHHFKVSRDSKFLQNTYAEAFLDKNVRPARRYYYTVVGCEDEQESETAVVANFSVSTRVKRYKDHRPPVAPYGLKAVGTPQGIHWSWGPSSKSPQSDLLAYLFENDDRGPYPFRAIIWERSEPVLSWDEYAPAGESRAYRVRAIDKYLNVSKTSSNLVTGKSGGRANHIRDPQFGWGYVYDSPYWFSNYGVYQEDYIIIDDSPDPTRRVWIATCGVSGYWSVNQEPSTVSIITDCPLGLPDNCQHALHYHIPEMSYM